MRSSLANVARPCCPADVCFQVGMGGGEAGEAGLFYFLQTADIKNPSPSLFYMKLCISGTPNSGPQGAGSGTQEASVSATEMHDNPTGPRTLSAPNNLSPEPYFDTKDLVGSNYCSANPERTQCQPVEKIQQTAAATVPLPSMAQVLHLPKSSGHRTWKQRIAFSSSCRRRDRSGTAAQHGTRPSGQCTRL